jgi:hypothetical protein
VGAGRGDVSNGESRLEESRRTTALRVVSQVRQKYASGSNGWTRAANLGESPTLQVRDDRGKLRARRPEQSRRHRLSTAHNEIKP